MWTVAIVSLLTIALVISIFLGSIIVLWKHPPVIKVTLAIPDRFVLVQQKQPATIETDPSIEPPIPAEVLDYINLESDTWAQDARKRRARALFNDSRDWKYAFRMLQKEDGQA